LTAQCADEIESLSDLPIGPQSGKLRVLDIDRTHDLQPPKSTMSHNSPAMILAGGRGLRLGTRDKALCRLGTQTLLGHGLDRLRLHCTPVALNANGDVSRFSQFDVQVVPDSLDGHLGPLAGVLAAMDWAASLGYMDVITIAVDTPFFPKNLTQRLSKERAPNTIALAATRDPQGHLWHHPTFGIWPTDLRDQLRADVLNGARKVTAWTKTQEAGHVVFDTGDFDPFFNINTPEDLQKAQLFLNRSA
jgi:molybdopterin-guanine dinucleotide biosynthesis protein A